MTGADDKRHSTSLASISSNLRNQEFAEGMPASTKAASTASRISFDADSTVTVIVVVPSFSSLNRRRDFRP
jgi:hypothetical protein